MVDSDGNPMGATLETVAATLSTLKTDVDELSERTTEQFKQIDLQFKQVDQRFTQVDQRFTQVDQRFTQVEQLIRSEGERTRRHFDVVAEQMKAERNLVLDSGSASAAKVNEVSASIAADRELVEKTLADHEAGCGPGASPAAQPPSSSASTPESSVPRLES